MDLGFEQLLAKHNQDFKEAEVFSNWMPPDGEYIVSLVKLDHGSTTKDGVEIAWWRLTGRIEDVQDEKLNGREFSAGYYTSKAYGILKGAVKTLAGVLITDLKEAHVILESSIGKIIRAKIDTRPGKGANAGRDFTNCYIQEVINTEAVVQEVPADVETVPETAPAPVGPDGIYVGNPAEEPPVV